LLAFKLNNKVSSSILTVSQLLCLHTFQTDPQVAFSECMKTKLAFFKWPSWIENYMKRKMFNERETNPQVARALRMMEISS
jgi:hypothetical protein